MLNKLLKYDLKRCFSWFWILSIVTFACSGLTRLVGLGGGFWGIIKGFFNGFTIALIANVVLQPFIRIFVGLQKDVYGDESYLTHTLPVTKNQILFSKLISALIQMMAAFIVLAISLLILYWTPSSSTNINYFINFIFENLSPAANIGAGGTIVILIILVLLSFFAIIATGFTSVIITNKNVKNKKPLISILIALAIIYAQNLVSGLLAILMAIVCGADLTAELMPPAALLAFVLTYIITNIIYIVAHVLISKWQFNKGVNVD